MPGSEPADPWKRATWKGAELETALAGARLTLAERLEWLEQAGDVARRIESERGRLAAPPLPRKSIG